MADLKHTNKEELLRTIARLEGDLEDRERLMFVHGLITKETPASIIESAERMACTMIRHHLIDCHNTSGRSLPFETFWAIYNELYPKENPF